MAAVMRNRSWIFDCHVFEISATEFGGRGYETSAMVTRRLPQIFDGRGYETLSLISVADP